MCALRADVLHLQAGTTSCCHNPSSLPFEALSQGINSLYLHQHFILCLTCLVLRGPMQTLRGTNVVSASAGLLAAARVAMISFCAHTNRDRVWAVDTDGARSKGYGLKYSKTGRGVRFVCLPSRTLKNLLDASMWSERFQKPKNTATCKTVLQAHPSRYLWPLTLHGWTLWDPTQEHAPV